MPVSKNEYSTSKKPSPVILFFLKTIIPIKQIIKSSELPKYPIEKTPCTHTVLVFNACDFR